MWTSICRIDFLNLKPQGRSNSGILKARERFIDGTSANQLICDVAFQIRKNIAKQLGSVKNLIHGKSLVMIGSDTTSHDAF